MKSSWKISNLELNPAAGWKISWIEVKCEQDEFFSYARCPKFLRLTEVRRTFHCLPKKSECFFYSLYSFSEFLQKILDHFQQRFHTTLLLDSQLYAGKGLGHQIGIPSFYRTNPLFDRENCPVYQQKLKQYFSSYFPSGFHQFSYR